MALYRTGLYVKNHTVEQVQVAKSPIASYNGNVTGLYIPELIAYITAVQSGSGDPSPDNIRPISGVSECNVCNTPMPVAPLWSIDSSFDGTVVFNQLFDKANYLSSVSAHGLTATNNGNGTITINGTYTGSGGGTNYISLSIATPFLHAIKDHKYLYICPSSPLLVFSVLCGNPAVMGYKTSNGSTVVNCLNTGDTYVVARLQPKQNTTFTNFVYSLCVIDLTAMFGPTIADYIYSLEQGTAGAGVAFFRSIYPNDYYAYNTGTDEMVGSREGNTYTTPFGQTIYGGELDVTSGVLTVTHANIASYNGEPINEPWICSEAVYSEGTTPPIGSQVVYPLATPITVQLTPTQVEQLLGANNVWADTGDVEVKFYNVIR